MSWRTTALAYARTVRIALVVLGAGAVGFLPGQSSNAASRDAKRPLRMTIYSVAVHEQFIDHSDDRARGNRNNPFGIRTSKAADPLNETTGPFPGDQAVFSFKLYAGADLSKQIGTGVFTCEYYFGSNAFCDSTFQFSNGGGLVGNGTFGAAAKKFALAITSGYGTYLGRTGDVEATAMGHHAQRLAFVLN